MVWYKKKKKNNNTGREIDITESKRNSIHMEKWWKKFERSIEFLRNVSWATFLEFPPETSPFGFDSGGETMPPLSSFRAQFETLRNSFDRPAESGHVLFLSLSLSLRSLSTRGTRVSYVSLANRDIRSLPQSSSNGDCWNCRSMGKILGNSSIERSWAYSAGHVFDNVSRAAYFRLRSLETRETRNSTTTPSSSVPFLLSSLLLASSVCRFRFVYTFARCILEFQQFRKSLELFLEQSAIVTRRSIDSLQHSLPKIVTHARSHYRQFSYKISDRIAWNFSISTDNFRDSKTRFGSLTIRIVQQLQPKFHPSFSFIPNLFKFQKLSTLHTMFTIGKKKKKRKISSPAIPNRDPCKILDFIPFRSSRCIATLDFTRLSRIFYNREGNSDNSIAQ